MNKPTYSTSCGDRLTTQQIELRMTKAKKKLIENQFIDLGYNVCSKCFKNDCKPLDCSHNISVKKAKEMGRAELCFDISNMEVLGRRCHQIKDKLI